MVKFDEQRLNEAEEYMQSMRPKKPMSSGGKFAIGGVIIFGVLFLLARYTPVAPTAPQVTTQRPTDPAMIAPSAAIQAERGKLIKKLMNGGVIMKLKPTGSMMEVYVGPGFYIADIDAKKLVCNLIWSYYFQGKDGTNFVLLENYQTGKKVGTYTPDLGLDLE